MLWGSRFKEKMNSNAMEFSSSLSFDINLIEEDVEGSIAHAEMLYRVGIISGEESVSITSGLTKLLSEFKNEKWKPNINKFEDIHSAIESRLFELIGNTAGKLHSGRSRNDQVATSFKLWMKKALNETVNEIILLQSALISKAENHTETIMPGYTHLQRAQPISFAFHLLAYVEMLERDKKRLLFTLDETDQSPLGSGALAGSTLPLDRYFTSQKLSFGKLASNALDAVSDRDFVLDFLNAVVLGMMHLSRLSEELILWSSSEWNFIKIGDDFTTGSSLMPQKKNPDMAELIRGKSGRAYGNYISVATMLKGLPLSYNRDMQEDKEPVFDSFNTYVNSLQIMNGMINSIRVNEKRFVKVLDGDFIFATELAEWLVLKGIPFREAHSIVGEIVRLAEEKNLKLNQLSIEQLKNINSIFDETALDLFTIENALYRKKTPGSPNPDMVKKEIERWKKSLSKN